MRYVNYYYLTSPHRLNNDYEEVIKNRCSLAENYSDLIITSKVDQVSYFKDNPFISILIKIFIKMKKNTKT